MKPSALLSGLGLLLLLSCSPPPFVAVGRTDITPPPSREEALIASRFVGVFDTARPCITKCISSFPFRKEADFTFLVTRKGAFYLARVSKPGDRKHVVPIPKDIGACLSSAALADSIPDSVFMTWISSRVRRYGNDSVALDTFAVGYSNTGGRSKKSIMDVVVPNVRHLVAAYRHAIMYGFRGTGKVTVKFAIDEFGRVISCRVMESTLGSPALENEVRDIVAGWVFQQIDLPLDVTDVVYPFVFSK